MTAYIAFISDSLGGIIKEATGADKPLSPWYFGILCAVIYIPLCWVRKIQFFNKFHLFADIIIVVMVTAVVVYGAIHLKKYPHPPGKFQPVNSEFFLEMVGFAVYSYEGIGVVLPVYEITERKKDFGGIFFAVMTTVLVSYVLFGEFCYFVYGSALGKTTIITQLMPANDWVVWVLKILFCFNLVFSYPLMLHPANIAIESYLFHGWPKTKKRQWSKNLFRACLVIFTVVITILMQNNLDQFLAVLGSLACTPVAFLLPTLYHLKACAETPMQKRVDWIIIVLSIIIMVFTTIFDITKWI